MDRKLDLRCDSHGSLLLRFHFKKDSAVKSIVA